MEFRMPFSSGGVMQRLAWLGAAQPYALAAWLIGVTLFGSRLLAGIVGISRLRRSRLPLPPKMVVLVERLGRRLAINALPLVCLSKQVADAMAVGLVRPLVLIPATWATEMPLPMLEAVIAHELAHLVRRDLWVNLLQRIVETLLFYHPAVWWLSRRLRIERELCADQLAVSVTGDRTVYAQALEHIASGRQAEIRPALAAFLRGETDMRLLQRVRNILGQPTTERSRLWPAGIIALALPLGLWAATALDGVAIADDEGDEPKKPTIKRESGDSDAEGPIKIRKKDPRREEGGDGKRDVEVIEDRIIRYRPTKIDKPLRDEIVEERVIKRDGKPIVEVQLGRKEASGDQGDRRIDELTKLVKRLAAQVERLQDEVTQLRGGKSGEKQPAEKVEQLQRRRKEVDERDQLDSRKRELEQEAEKIETAQRALAEKQRALAELAKQDGEARARMKKELVQKLEAEKQEKAAQASLEKAEAARVKAEAARAIEEKIRKLKEKGELGPEEFEAVRRKLLNEKALLISPGDKPNAKRLKEPR